MVLTTQWPNGLGWDVTVGNVKYEVWPSGSVVRLRKDDSLTGYKGTRYVETHQPAPVAAALVPMLADYPDVWTPCYEA